MIEMNARAIINEAKELVVEKKNWHFHLLTPGCVFNTKKEFALVLENTTDNRQIVNYSDKKQDEEAKKLLELLHGINADETKNFEANTDLSPNVSKMVGRAKELIEKKIPWHHHALFPSCIFNKTKNKWVVMLEDPETGEVLENVTDGKPDSDLQLIEPLFYHQKKES